jgi:hypothetical protein
LEPAADELDESPVKKLPEAAEAALPKSVAAPVLDADPCAPSASSASAGVDNVGSTSPMPKIADMATSNRIVLFMVTGAVDIKLFIGCETLWPITIS